MPKSNQIPFYREAPDLTLLNTAGEPVQLSSLWAEKPLLLSFTRHFGCTQCKEMLDELVAGRERILASGLNIASHHAGHARSHGRICRPLRPRPAVPGRPRARAYQAFGLERGNLFQTFLNPKVWRRYPARQQKGYKVEPPPAGQDAMQMSGTFIISTDGKIVLPYYYDHIADHPPLELLLNGVLSTRWDKPFEGPVGPGVDENEKFILEIHT